MNPKKFKLSCVPRSIWAVIACAPFVLFTLLDTPARADVKEFYAQRAALKKTGSYIAPISRRFDALIDHWFEQKLKHGSAEDMRTFKQRYWVDSSLAKNSDAPVLFYICGESTCSGSAMQRTLIADAAKLSAHMVALEHRYYGLSQPFDQLTSENLQYLTVENALEDLAQFQDFAQKELGLNGKWISVGGSYPGALSAFYRTLYPGRIQGALASSAPVQALENFEAYDRHVFEVAGPECALAMRKVVALIEDSLSDSSRINAIQKIFSAEAIRDHDDFLYLVADVGASAIQYGYHKEFCDSLTQASDPVQAYADFAQKIFSLWGVDAVGFSVQSAEDLDPQHFLKGFGYRQWLYQSCKEFGFFQNAYHDPAFSVRSARINPDYHRRLCQRLFGINEPVGVEQTNSKYYTPLLREASQILLTNGSDDPWSLLGIAPVLGNDTNPNLSVLLIQGASHCSDLRPPSETDPSPLTEAKQKFLDLASSWIQ